MLPSPILPPTTEVVGVYLKDAGPEATRFDVVVKVENPNDTALPLEKADYSVDIDGASYTTDTVPNVILPAGGDIRFRLPAILAGSVAAGGTYTVRGAVVITPPTDVGTLLYGWFLPKPRASFEGTGAVVDGGG